MDLECKICIFMNIILLRAEVQPKRYIALEVRGP
jgi:hypothetical protein